MKSSFPALSTPVTCAPRRLASWIANDPDPPPPPFTSTRRPGAAPTVPWSAIAPAWGMVDASANVRSTGLWASAESAATAYSAKPPLSERLSFSPRPITDALAALGLGAGPPAPAGPPPPDEWMRRLGTVPLMYQPGERWLYHTSAEVLGVLIARATGQTFDAFLAERVFGPLAMADTGFSVPADKLDRFGACFGADPATGERTIYDVADGQWSTPPAFPSRRAGGGC